MSKVVLIATQALFTAQHLIKTQIYDQALLLRSPIGNAMVKISFLSLVSVHSKKFELSNKNGRSMQRILFYSTKSSKKKHSIVNAMNGGIMSGIAKNRAKTSDTDKAVMSSTTPKTATKSTIKNADLNKSRIKSSDFLSPFSTREHFSPVSTHIPQVMTTQTPAKIAMNNIKESWKRPASSKKSKSGGKRKNDPVAAKKVSAASKKKVPSAQVPSMANLQSLIQKGIINHGTLFIRLLKPL